MANLGFRGLRYTLPTENQIVSRLNVRAKLFSSDEGKELKRMLERVEFTFCGPQDLNRTKFKQQNLEEYYQKHLFVPSIPVWLSQIKFNIVGDYIEANFEVTLVEDDFCILEQHLTSMLNAIICKCTNWHFSIYFTWYDSECVEFSDICLRGCEFTAN